MDDEFINVVTCSVWVPRGAANENPHKVEISKDDLARVIKETSENLEELSVNEVEENVYTSLELEAAAKDLKINAISQNERPNDVEMEDEDGTIVQNEQIPKVKPEADDLEKEYGFEADGDEDKEDGLSKFMDLGLLAVHADNKDDPNLKIKDDDTDSEKENHKILPTDNLIAVGHVEGDAAILEVYVYNSTEASLYVHHDVLLPAVPLCMEWLNFDPMDKELKPGNLVAIGSMAPVIEVWDLDMMDCLEPTFKLGRRPNKKKKVSRLGHSDAVLCLAWNRDLEHVMASGSTDRTVILWDIQKCQESQKITSFGHRVQDLKWNPQRNHHLLTGSSDKFVRLIDCVDEDSSKSWKLDGEVECVVWDPSTDDSYTFYAGTDVGTIYSIDSRQESKPLQKFQAHKKTCTGLSLVSECRGCLVTVSEDSTVKIWDVAQPKPVLVEEYDPGLDIIHSVSSSVDSPFVLSLAGNNKMNNFKVWDIRTSKKVRIGFSDRLGLPIEEDDEEKESGMDAEMGGERPAPPVQTNSEWKPSKKSRKKKGGRLDKKKKGFK